MGQAHGHMCVGQAHGYILIGQAHEHMLMGLAHEHMLRGPSQEAGKPNWRWRVTKPNPVRSANTGFPPNPISIDPEVSESAEFGSHGRSPLKQVQIPIMGLTRR